MFEYSEGTYHLVFANQDDSYFPDNLIRMNFIPYLRYSLIEKGYRYIYIFGESCRSPSKGFAVQYVGSQSKAALAAKKGIGFGFFSGGKQKALEINYDIEQEELDEAELSDMLLNVLQYIKKTDHAAAAVPASLFQQHTAGQQALLEELRKSVSKSIVVLTTSVTAAENDAFFISDDLRFTGRDTPGEKNRCVFWNERVFPEVRDTFCKSKDDLEKTIFTYTALKRSFGIRMQIWNELSYNSLFNAVRYFFIRSQNLTGIGGAPGIAAVIWAWYNNPVFRDKRPISFTNNPYRLCTIILNDLTKPEILSRIIEIAREENAEQTSEFIKRYELFEEPSYIRNISATGDAQTAFRIFCEVTRGKMTGSGEERRRQLIKRAPLFTLPSYVSSYCLEEPPHLMMSGFKDRISSVLEAFKSRSAWDCWHTAAAQIFTEMLIMFTDVMREKCSVDSGNQLCAMKLEIAIEAAEYCLKMSPKGGSEEEALDICENTAAIMKLNDAEFAKNYGRIKQELSLAKVRNTQS